MNKDFNATLARVAGNLMSGLPGDWLPGGDKRKWAVVAAVKTARDILDEIKRTELELEEKAGV